MPSAERSVVIARRVLRRMPEGPGERIANWVFGGAFVLVMSTLATRNNGGGSIATLPGVVGSVLILHFGARRIDAWRNKRDRARLQSLPPCCLACGYELTGIGEADDGCTVCPECGGAWHLPLFAGASGSGGE